MKFLFGIPLEYKARQLNVSRFGASSWLQNTDGVELALGKLTCMKLSMSFWFTNVNAFVVLSTTNTLLLFVLTLPTKINPYEEFVLLVVFFDSIWQTLEHPSPLMRFPSSQAYPLDRIPSPQTAGPV